MTPDRFLMGVEAAARFLDAAALGWSESVDDPTAPLRADTLRDAARAIRSIPAPANIDELTRLEAWLSADRERAVDDMSVDELGAFVALHHSHDNDFNGRAAMLADAIATALDASKSAASPPREQERP